MGNLFFTFSSFSGTHQMQLPSNKEEVHIFTCRKSTFPGPNWFVNLQNLGALMYRQAAAQIKHLKDITVTNTNLSFFVIKEIKDRWGAIPVVEDEHRTHWGNPSAGRSSVSWRITPHASQSEPCVGCSSLLTSGSPSKGMLVLQTEMTGKTMMREAQ